MRPPVLGGLIVLVILAIIIVVFIVLTRRGQPQAADPTAVPATVVTPAGRRDRRGIGAAHAVTTTDGGPDGGGATHADRLPVYGGDRAVCRRPRYRGYSGWYR